MLSAMVLRSAALLAGVLFIGLPTTIGASSPVLATHSTSCSTIPTDAMVSNAADLAASDGSAKAGAPEGVVTARVVVGSAVMVEVDGSGRPTAVATNNGKSPGCPGATWLIWSPGSRTSSPASVAVINDVRSRLGASETWSSKAFHRLLR